MATLARDHEFTFLDHALKCGDSLVGLTMEQIAAVNWDLTKSGLPLFRRLVTESVAKAIEGRAEIQNAPDDTMRVVQESRHRNLESEVAPIRLIGDGVLSAFFAADKPKPREKARADVESYISGMPPRLDLLEEASKQLRSGEYGVSPFHWQVEYPEVFTRQNGGFDAIVGNPPFLGGSYITRSYGAEYFYYLVQNYSGCIHHCDYVGYFVRRNFELVRSGGVVGVIATKTIAQGDTREGALHKILDAGGRIIRARRSFAWPGEASVFVVVLHISKGALEVQPDLDGTLVSRISAFLVPGSEDSSPLRLAGNPYISQGSQIYGKGFLFDDTDASANSIARMQEIIAESPNLKSRILPFIGGDEVNSESDQSSHRYVIFLSDLKEEGELKKYSSLENIVREKVLPERMRLRDTSSGRQLKKKWWAYQAHRPKLYEKAKLIDRVIVNSLVSSHLSFVFVPSESVFSHKLGVIPSDKSGLFACVQSRPHEVWTRFLSAPVGDGVSYSPTDCFSTFPFPVNFEGSASLDLAGARYHAFRAKMMQDRGEGLTATYNRFHARGDNKSDITRLRELHAEMDEAVLRAYGWDDLADRAEPEFIEQAVEEGRPQKTRFDWPAEFKDDVLARLLALNAERAAEDRAAGLTSELADDELLDSEEAD